MIRIRPFSSKTSQAAFFIMAALFSACFLSPWLIPHDPLAVDMGARFLPPSWPHILGTDTLGRDVLSRLLHGGRTSILLALGVTGLGMAAGLTVGLIAGYVGGPADRLILGITNIFFSLPGLTLMVAVAGVMGPGIFTIVTALCLTNWMGFSRIIRAEVIRLREENYIAAARTMGGRSLYIITRHILPGLRSLCLVTFTTRISRAMIAISSLNYLGFGLAPPAPDWGGMIREAIFYFRSAPHLILAPGLCLFLFTFSVNILGDALRDRLDVRYEVSRYG